VALLFVIRSERLPPAVLRAPNTSDSGSGVPIGRYIATAKTRPDTSWTACDEWPRAELNTAASLDSDLESAIVAATFLVGVWSARASTMPSFG
jgi:hypothetical protein